MKKIKPGNIIMQILLIAFAAMQLFPLYWMITFSLKGNMEIFGGNVLGLPQNWRFDSDSRFKTITTGVMELIGKYSTQWGPVGAGLVIATIPTLILYMALSENVQKSLAAGAVKG